MSRNHKFKRRLGVFVQVKLKGFPAASDDHFAARVDNGVCLGLVAQLTRVIVGNYPILSSRALP